MLTPPPPPNQKEQKKSSATVPHIVFSPLGMNARRSSVANVSYCAARRIPAPSAVTNDLSEQFLHVLHCSPSKAGRKINEEIDDGRWIMACCRGRHWPWCGDPVREGALGTLSLTAQTPCTDTAAAVERVSLAPSWPDRRVSAKLHFSSKIRFL